MAIYQKLNDELKQIAGNGNAIAFNKDIIDSGENERGQWIKFSNGWMICTHILPKEELCPDNKYSWKAQDITIYRSGAPQWYYPQEFIDDNVNIQVTPNTNLEGTRLAISRAFGVSKTNAVVQLVGLEEWFGDNPIAYNNLENVSVIAIGKWSEHPVQQVDSLTLIYPANAGAHNSVYRGKDITELWYDGTLSEQIAAGTFNDIFVGDYIIGKNSKRKYIVADLNYYFNMAQHPITTPHILMISEDIMGLEAMNAEENTAKGGYPKSEMHLETLDKYRTIINNDFENHILKHEEIFATYTLENDLTTWAWYDNCTVELMNEHMVFGSKVFNLNGHEVGIGSTQLALFRYRPDLIVAKDNNDRQLYWLRDVVSDTSFSRVSSYGFPYSDESSRVLGVRPYFLLY